MWLLTAIRLAVYSDEPQILDKAMTTKWPNILIVEDVPALAESY